MNKIKIDNNKIIINNEIVFERKYPNFNIPNNVCQPITKFNNNIDKNLNNNKRLPHPLWCLNEKNGECCNMKFRNKNLYNIHQEVCLFKEHEIIEDEIETNEDYICNLDDETLNLIESYERLTGHNILIQMLLGQIDYNLIDNIRKEYYYDIDELEKEYYSEDEIIHHVY